MINPKYKVLNEQQIQQLHKIYTNSFAYTKQQVLSKTKALRHILSIQQNHQQKITLIMDSNLYSSIYNFMVILLKHVKDQIIPKYQVAPSTYAQQKLSIQAQILRECLWIFINLCLGNPNTVNKIVALGVMKFTQQTLIMYEYPSFVECTIQLIGNLLAQQNLQIKLYYLKSKIFAQFLQKGFLNVWSYNGCDQLITWTISNAFKGLSKMMSQHETEVKQLLQFYLPIVSMNLNLPKSNENSDINLYWSLSCMTFEWNYFYQQVHMLLCNRFQDSSLEKKRAIIQVYGNMVSKSQIGVKVVIEHELILPFILNCLKNMNPNPQQQKFMKNCAWILSNILAGTKQQIDFLLTNYSTFFNQIYQILLINSKYSIVNELTWAISNMLENSSIQAFEMLYSSNILVCFAQKVSMILKQNQDQKLAQIYLLGIESYILKHSQFPQKFKLQIRQKMAIMKTLGQIKDYLKHQGKKIRVMNAVAKMESIIVIEEIGSISLE